MSNPQRAAPNDPHGSLRSRAATGSAGGKPRVCQVVTRSDSIGGAQVHVLHLSAALLERGWDVTVLAGGAGPFLDLLRSRRVPHRSLQDLGRRIDPRDDLRALTELRGALSELRPDLVAAHSSKAGWLARRAAHRLGLPSVFTAHGWAFAPGVPARRRLLAWVAERRAARWGRHVICVSDYDRRLALRGLGLAAGAVSAIHNGLPDHPARARPAGGRPLRLLMTARFEPQKDHGTLLRALARLPDAEAVLVGDGPLLPRVRREAEALGVAARTRFLGHRDDVPELLATADVFVLSSRWEGLPFTIIEAMRAGLPVVATAVGGVGEAVEDGTTGLLFPRGDAGGLQARLASLLDPQRREALGRAGRRRYEERFGLERMVDRTLDVYRRCMQPR